MGLMMAYKMDSLHLFSVEIIKIGSDKNILIFNIIPILVIFWEKSIFLTSNYGIQIH